MRSTFIRRIGVLGTIAGAAVALGSGAAMADSVDSASSDGSSPIASFDINGYHGGAGFLTNAEDTVWSFCDESWPIHPTQYGGVITELSAQNGHGYFLASPIGGQGDDYGCNGACPPGVPSWDMHRSAPKEAAMSRGATEQPARVAPAQATQRPAATAAKPAAVAPLAIGATALGTLNSVEKIANIGGLL